MKQIDKEAIISYLRQLKPVLKEKGIDRIGLFGSIAKGTDDLMSDIDIVIRTTPDFVHRFKGIKAFIFLEDLRRDISRQFGRGVDIYDEAGSHKKIESIVYA
ncbi:MAG: nucleotidyltransferase domain-containing protein [Sulfurovum sp.]|nr:nucleotidyltransferase domain-containing protein [Sulfurovum sp.]